MHSDQDQSKNSWLCFCFKVSLTLLTVAVRLSGFIFAATTLNTFLVQHNNKNWRRDFSLFFAQIFPPICVHTPLPGTRTLSQRDLKTSRNGNETKAGTHFHVHESMFANLWPIHWKSHCTTVVVWEGNCKSKTSVCVLTKFLCLNCLTILIFFKSYHC